MSKINFIKLEKNSSAELKSFRLFFIIFRLGVFGNKICSLMLDAI